MKKFNEYVYGAKFHIITDHKPLVQLFHIGRKLPEGTVKKLQRWALFLSDYNYEIHYRATSQHAKADALSRCPAGPDMEFDESEEECQQLDDEDWQNLQEFPLTSAVVAAAIDRDAELKTVRDFVRKGWPPRLLRSNAKWFNKKDRLSVREGVLLYHSEQHMRVIIPKSLQKQILDMLHEGHWGDCKHETISKEVLLLGSYGQGY